MTKASWPFTSVKGEMAEGTGAVKQLRPIWTELQWGELGPGARQNTQDCCLLQKPRNLQCAIFDSVAARNGRARAVSSLLRELAKGVDNRKPRLMA